MRRGRVITQKGCLEIQCPLYPLLDIRLSGLSNNRSKTVSCLLFNIFFSFFLFWYKPVPPKGNERSYVLMCWNLWHENRTVFIVKAWSLHFPQTLTRSLTQMQTYQEDVAWLVKTQCLAQQKPDLPLKNTSPVTGFPLQESVPFAWEGVELSARQGSGVGIQLQPAPSSFLAAVDPKKLDSPWKLGGFAYF